MHMAGSVWLGRSCRMGLPLWHTAPRVAPGVPRKLTFVNQFAAMRASRYFTDGSYHKNFCQITPAGHAWLAYTALLIAAAVMWMR
jgi:hypothetical protein